MLPRFYNPGAERGACRRGTPARGRGAGQSETPVSLEDLTPYRPRIDWWARRDGGYGIHGPGHCARVLLWADYAAARLAADGTPVDRAVVRWAAACHDCRRHDEGLDSGHGLRAAAWFGMQAPLLDAALSSAQVAAVQWAVTWHVPPDEQCPHWTPELQCVKDADGLDRVRLGDFDPGYLRLPYLHGREPDARALLPASIHGSRCLWPPALSSAKSLAGAHCVRLQAGEATS